MKRILFCIGTMLLASSIFAQEVPQWVRRSAISPDGKTIAFSYKGDIYTVPSGGGLALQITSNKAYESDPFWTADGKQIVFSSWREGSKDIFVTRAEGGTPLRLTDMPGSGTPLAVSKDGFVYFTWYTTELMSPGFDGFPGDPSLYRTNLEGKAPELVTSLTISAMKTLCASTIHPPSQGISGNGTARQPSQNSPPIMERTATLSSARTVIPFII